MKLQFLGVLIAILLAACAAPQSRPPAPAADATSDVMPPLPQPSPQLLRYTNDLKVHQLAFLALEHIWWDSYTYCASMQSRDWTVVESFTVTFDASGKPINGAWFDEAVMSGCGYSHKVSMFTAAIDGKLKQLRALPGTTYTDFLLQHGSVPYAIDAAEGIVSPTCDNADIYGSVRRIVDTRFVGFEGAPFPDAPPGRQARPWREDWVVAGCDAHALVVMHFVPDPNGGTRFIANPDETKRIDWTASGLQ
ncbi:MAG TPA: hypothetical protein VHE77_05335 [Dongiaceae bacterium]|jgi:hypothetical protein|nr:hypothetical protein [Dongiaceae bacterium]